MKRRRAEKAQLLREVEALADTFEFSKAQPALAAAQEAWAKLPSEDGDGDERFAKAIERFGNTPYLVTVSADALPRATSVRVQWEGELLTTSAGRRTNTAATAASASSTEARRTGRPTTNASSAS